MHNHIQYIYEFMYTVHVFKIWDPGSEVATSEYIKKNLNIQ